jgi:spermidine synthase
VDGLEASVVDLADPLYLEMPYMRWIAAFVTASSDSPGDVLHLGGGACTLARWLAVAHEGSRSRAFEVDAEVVAVAREHLGLDDVPGLKVSVADAADGVCSLPPRSFDVVVADVFVGPRVPDHLITVEALQDVRRVLRPGGAYVANLIDEAPLRRSRRQVATVAYVFGAVTLVAERATLRGRRAGNIVVAAGRTFGNGRIGRAANGADILDGEAAALWCGGARPLYDAPSRNR